MKFEARVVGAEEPVPDDCELLATPYEFFNEHFKFLRPKGLGKVAVQIPKCAKKIRRLVGSLLIDVHARDIVIKRQQETLKIVVAQLDNLSQEVQDYQNEILILDEQIDNLRGATNE
jgi:Holliday junction resolvase RusA-like endonuclease